MPLYEYSCDACGKTFEVSQKMSDPPVTDCACGAKGTVHRLIGAGAGVIFKGSGFYSNDYAGSSKAAAAKADCAPAAAPAATTATPAKTGGHSCGPGCSH